MRREQRMLQLKRLYGFGLFDLLTAVPTGAARVIIPELKHRLAKMLDDICAVEVDVLYERSTIITIEDNVLFLSRRPPAFHHDADRFRRPLRRVRYIGWNEESFPFMNDMVHDRVPLPDTHLDVAFELIEILLRIDDVKIVSRIWTRDHHHEEIASIIQIAIAYWRLEEVTIFFNPIV